MNQKGFSVVGILIIAVVLGLGISGYLFFANQDVADVEEVADSAMQEVDVKENKDEVVVEGNIWEAYRSEKAGFEIKHPPGWFVNFRDLSLDHLKSFEIGIANVDINKPFSEREVVEATIDARELNAPCGVVILSSPTVGSDIWFLAEDRGYGSSADLKRLTIGGELALSPSLGSYIVISDEQVFEMNFEGDDEVCQFVVDKMMKGVSFLR
ncbi:MAG: hypothetical protein HYT03_00955 [Candidatus Harrisonbacteria bacterium]|nr:hypothetical protein [Candidatus Harrisonbacteria bacterium]